MTPLRRGVLFRDLKQHAKPKEGVTTFNHNGRRYVLCREPDQLFEQMFFCEPVEESGSRKPILIPDSTLVFDVIPAMNVSELCSTQALKGVMK